MSDKSPCVTCERVYLDKKKCSTICERRFAYLAGADWSEAPIPSKEKIEEIKNETGEDAATTSEPATAKVQHRNANKKTCTYPGCDKPLKARGLCGPCYDKWRKGELPNWPEFKAIQLRGKKKNKTPRAIPKGNSEKQTGPRVVIDLTKYPQLYSIVFNTAEKFFITPEHLIISLIGEAISGREANRGQPAGGI